MIHSGSNIARVIRFEHSKNASAIGECFRITINNILGEQKTFQYLVPFGKKPHNLIWDLDYFYKSKKWAALELKEVNGLLSITEITEIKDKTQDEVQNESLLLRTQK